MSETQTPMVVTKTWVDLQFAHRKPPILQCMQYDANLRLLEVRLLKDGADWPVPEGWTVNLRMKKSDGTSIYQSATYEGSRVYLVLTGQMCCVAGEHSFVLEIAGGDHVIQTPVLLLKVWKNPLTSLEFTSQSEYTALQEMVEDAKESMEAAQSAAQTVAETAQSVAENAQAAASQAAKAASSAASAQKDAAQSQTSANQAYTYSQSCNTLYQSVEELHQQISQQLETILSVDANQNLEILSQAEYDALTPPNPKRLYLAESNHPINHLVGYFPLQGNLDNQLQPTTAATAVGGSGFADWDGTGISYRSCLVDGSMTLSQLVSDHPNSNIQIYDNGYIMLPRQEGSTDAYVALPLADPNPFEAGVTYTFEASMKNPVNGAPSVSYGNAGKLALAKADNTVLFLSTIVTSSGTGASGSIRFTAPENIKEYTQLRFYYDVPDYYQYITISITRSISPTVQKNYLTLPASLFARKDFSNGISFVVDLKPDNFQAGAHIFQFRALASGSGVQGELYATQGSTAVGLWESETIQQAGGSDQGVPAGSWHTYVFTVSSSQLCTYVDGTLCTTAKDTGATLRNLLSHLDRFNQNYLGYSPAGDNDYAGLLKNFRIYDKALSATEAAQINNSASARLYWGSLLLADSQEEA